MRLFLLFFVSCLPAAAAPKVSCTALSNQVVSYDRVTKVTTEREVWEVTCVGKDKPLSASYPTLHEAMTAIEKYRGDCVGECDRACQEKCFKKGECPAGWRP